MNEGRRAQIFGCGLIGGSIAARLAELGWFVTVTDINTAAAQAVQSMGYAHEVGIDPTADISFVATPVGQVVDTVVQALAQTEGIVTDVGSAKSLICESVKDPRFVGGHPMAGSEISGPEGSRGTLFSDAPWILTPSVESADSTLDEVFRVVRSLGAQPLVLDAKTHDELTAQVSHVPHLTAAALMAAVTETSNDPKLAFSLSGGGFRDMTRVSAGAANMWVDICQANSKSISNHLHHLSKSLSDLAEIVASGDSESLLNYLESARQWRSTLPHIVGDVSEFCLVQLSLSDEPGQIAEITRLAAVNGVNIYDLSIAHSVSSNSGLLSLVISAGESERLSQALGDGNFVHRVSELV